MEVTGIEEFVGGSTYTLNDGRELHVVQQAELTNRVFPGWFGDAKEGEEYTAEYFLVAEDADGERYVIVYQFDEAKGEEDDPDTLPWDEISRITEVVEM
jgi:hypothetical protein